MQLQVFTLTAKLRNELDSYDSTFTTGECSLIALSTYMIDYFEFMWICYIVLDISTRIWIRLLQIHVRSAAA